MLGQLGQADPLRKVFLNIAASPLDGFLLLSQTFFAEADVGIVFRKLCQGPGEARLAFQ